MPPRDAEVDRLEERALVRAWREDGERIMRDRAVVPGAFDRVHGCAMTFDELLSRRQILLPLRPLLQRAFPEAPLLLIAASVGEHDRERDLALPEIIADRLAHE